MTTPVSHHTHVDAYLGMTFPWVKTINLKSKADAIKLSFPNVTNYFFVESDGGGDIGKVDVEGLRFFNNSTTRDFKIVYEKVDARNYYARLNYLKTSGVATTEARLDHTAAELKEILDEAFKDYMVSRGPIRTQVINKLQNPSIEPSNPNWVDYEYLVFYLPKSTMQRLRIGFTEEGVTKEAGAEPGNYFEIRKTGRVKKLSIKCTDIWLYADGPDDTELNCRLTLGLTAIPRKNFPNLDELRAQGTPGI
jgi:hypothetical protein